MLWDEDGNVLNSLSVLITSTNGGQDPTNVPLGFTVPAGNNYISVQTLRRTTLSWGATT